MKLPDINFAPGAPEIQSGKAAGLGNKLRTIDAGVSAVVGLSKKVDGLLEAEVRLDATRRLNEAERNYGQKVRSISEKYHTNRDLPSEGFAGEIAAARSESFDGAYQNASGRVSKIGYDARDNFDTRVQPHEADMVEKLITSRSLMHLNDIQRTTLDSLNEFTDITELDRLLAANDEAWDSSKLDAPTVQENKTRFNAAAMAYQVKIWANDSNIAAMTALKESDRYKDVPPESRLALQTEIDVATTTILKNTQSGLEGEITDNTVALDNGLVMMHEKIVATGVSPAEQLTMGIASGEALFSAKVNGLLAKGMYDEASALLDDPKYSNVKFNQITGENLINVKPGAKVAGWRATIASGKARGTTTSIQILTSNVKDQNARFLAGGAVDPAVLGALDAALESTDLSNDQRASLMLEKARAITYSKYANSIGSLTGASPGQLDDMQGQVQLRLNELNTQESTVGYRDEITALNEVSAAAADVKKQRTNDPATFAINNDPATRDAFAAWQVSMAAFAEDPKNPDNLQNMQMAYTTYLTSSDQAQTFYGTSQRGRTVIPQASSVLSGMLEKFLTGDPAEQQSSIQALATVMGPRGLSDLVGTLMDSKPTQAMTLAYYALPNGAGFLDAQAMNRGIMIAEQQAGSIPNSEDYRKSLVSGNIDMPYTALGSLNRVASASVYTYALGIATDQELSNGTFTPETLIAARNAVIGEPFSIGPNANFSIPFRDEKTGVMVPSGDIKNTFVRAATESRYGNENFGVVYDGNGEAMDWGAALEYGTPIMVANGVYEIAVVNGSGFRTPGGLMTKNKKGELVRMQINLNSVNTSENRAYMVPLDLSRVN